MSRKVNSYVTNRGRGSDQVGLKEALLCPQSEKNGMVKRPCRSFRFASAFICYGGSQSAYPSPFFSRGLIPV